MCRAGRARAPRPPAAGGRLSRRRAAAVDGTLITYQLGNELIQPVAVRYCKQTPSYSHPIRQIDPIRRSQLELSSKVICV